MLWWLLAAYLAGSVPFGLLLAWAAGKGDIRKVGSGNIGATNVLRTGSRGLAALTVVLDGGKGAAVALLAGLYPVYFFLFACESLNSICEPSVAALISGLFAVLGHCFPVWLGFRGGKGLARARGVARPAVPLAGLAGCGAWLAAGWATRISPGGTVAALAAAPAAALAVYGPWSAAAALAISALVAARHAGNIRRLLASTEPRMGGKAP